MGKNFAMTDTFYSDQYIHRGIAFQNQNMFAEALNEYDTALAISPNDKYAHWNRATTLLSMGEYEEGFKEHEWAWTLFDWQGFGPVREDMARIRHLSIWNGEPIEDKQLLVYHELGFGDGIQTLRYLPELQKRAGLVTLVINTELVRLAERACDGIEIIDHVPADVSEYAYRLPFFGVMRALRQTRANVPSQPYVPVELKTLPLNKGEGFSKIGICWSGRTQTVFTLDYFLSNLKLDGYQLYSLQMGETIKNVRPLESKDFLDTARLISTMDHIITIDSAPAHLAGALGHPSVHLMLPWLCDWRWRFTEVWYPKIKTYQQETPQEWASVFARVNEALR